MNECVNAIHQCLLQQSGALKQAGVTPSFSSPGLQTSTSRAKTHQPLKSFTPSIDCLMEKLVVLNCAQQQNTRLSSAKDFEIFGGSEYCLNLPYIGPKSLQLFLQALCRLYKEKSVGMMTERAHLRSVSLCLITKQ